MKKNDKHKFESLTILGIILVLFSACGSAENNAKTVNDSNLSSLTENQNTTIAETMDTAMATDPDMKTPGATVMNMSFEGFAEKEYPEFKFRDLRAGNYWDFRFLNENKLGTVPILINDKKAKFGYKGNPEMLNKIFVVETIQKEITWKNVNGNEIKSKEWIITGIKAK